MSYGPYALPTIGGVKRLGIFAPGDDGFDRLPQSLDLFHTHGVRLIIQLGEALLPRGTARSTDIDHIRRLLGRRQQAMLVCTDDLGRTLELRRAGVRETGARTVRPNLTHLAPGYSTRLSNGDLFMVIGPDLVAGGPAGAAPVSDRSASGWESGRAGRVGLAVSAIHSGVAEVVHELAPKLFISGGSGVFVDEVRRLDDASIGCASSRVIVFGVRDGKRIDHALIQLSEGTVTFLPDLPARVPDLGVDRRQIEES